MKYTIRMMRICFVITLLVGIIGFAASGRDLTVYIPLPNSVQSEQELNLHWEQGHMTTEIRWIENGVLCLRVDAEEPGTHWLEITDSSGEFLNMCGFRTTTHGLIYDYVNGSFSGCYALTVRLIFFCISFALVFFHSFFVEKGTSIYTYRSILKFGMALFLSIFGIDLTLTFSRFLLHPAACGMPEIYSNLSRGAWSFIVLTAPLTLIFAAALILSNFCLLMHERRTLRNLLSSIAGFLMIGGFVLCAFVSMRSFSGSVSEMRMRETVNSVICTVYAYCECMLFSAAVNGLRAAMHKPPYDRDFILILGCGFRQDGTLTPLLKGRADAALRFRQAQLERTGKAAVLVPSGGKGSDEPIAEAEAISRYLLTQGIPKDKILKETRSTTTLENMKFSKALIETQMPNAKVAYATTNYHVFRSGIWARRAGLPAEGIGSKTRWWFWPNAFLREFIGLLQKQIFCEGILLLFMTAFFGAIAILVPR